MATLNQKIALNARLRKALHKNVYLLSLYYPMSKDLQAHFKEGMLEKPNTAAFHHLSYYLMSIIDPNIGSSSTSWAMFEIKMEAKYRSEFLKFVNHLAKEHEGHISHIVASWIVNAGGTKVTKLMFELSQTALKIHLQKRYPKMNLNFHDFNANDASKMNEEIQERTLGKMSWWRTHSFNMNKIAEIYLHHIPIVVKEKENKQTLLQNLKSSISSENEGVDQLTDIFSESKFLLKWGENIDEQTKDLNEKWGKDCKLIVEKSKKCKNRSEKLIQMHLNKSNKDYTLEYNENRDVLNLSICNGSDLSVSHSAILKSNIKDGVLHLPNFFKTYAVVMSYCFDGYSTNHCSEHFQCLLNDKRNVLMVVKDKSKDLVGELFKFHEELKVDLEPDISSSATSVNTSGILDILNIPSFTVQSIPNNDCSKFWQKSLDKYKFSEFNHPFKSEKTYFVAEKDPSFNNASRTSQSVIKKGFFNNSKEPLIQRKIEARPEYLKNIEELERNMFKITDVSNKTFAHPSNMTFSNRKGTDRRLSLHSQNHKMKYLLTSIKKKSSMPNVFAEKDEHERLFRKTRLFNETIESNSFLQKTQSSPNLSRESKSNYFKPATERISGIKEINYSSILSDAGSMPNLSDASDKENVPENRQTIITEKILIENEIKITSTNLSPKRELDSCKSKSIESIIDTYKKFKEARGLIGKSNEKREEKSNKDKGDSFLEKLDLGDDKRINKRVIQKDSDASTLSTVPDLLSPSLDFKSHKSDSDA